MNKWKYGEEIKDFSKGNSCLDAKSFPTTLFDDLKKKILSQILRPGLLKEESLVSSLQSPAPGADSGVLPGASY